jgi:fibronectin type 3 domain-containing protein
MNKKKNNYELKWFVAILFLFVSFPRISGQNNENIKAKAHIVNEHTIKLRWSPANPQAWLEGRKYGYIVDRYTLIIDSVYQENALASLTRQLIRTAPLPDWEEQVLKSDYAAVIAQAFYGEDFEFSSSVSDVGAIINQANELQQRFATSLYAAENDFKAAVLAGWAYTDEQAKKNERYLYRIILNRPEKQKGDTAAVFTGYQDKQELPQPFGLYAVWSDQSVLLSWNYELLSDTYHSYHIERMASTEQAFKRITGLPVTALNENMQTLFYTDSLPENNREYSYRIIGLTGYDEEGPASDTIAGSGKKSISCIPYLYSGYFSEDDRAHLHWEFECAEPELVDRLTLKRAHSPEGEYSTIKDFIPVDQRELTLDLKDDVNYVKLFAVHKDSTQTSSYYFTLNRIDSIPPAIPAGLTVTVDSRCVAHLAWNKNTEPDLRGYRILRSFTKEGEKSSVVSGFIPDNYYTDTLSLNLGNPNVYYSLTALDIRYNESQPCEEVAAVKPNQETPANPVFTSYIVSNGKVTLSWVTDDRRPEIRYALFRVAPEKPQYSKSVFVGNYKQNEYMDELPESGLYQYYVSAFDPDGKISRSPQTISCNITVSNELNRISRFDSYVDRNNNYIELSWKKQENAESYRLYKAEEAGKPVLWKELDAEQDRVIDENVSPDTRYVYTILFLSPEGRMSQSKTITVNY